MTISKERLDQLRRNSPSDGLYGRIIRELIAEVARLQIIEDRVNQAAIKKIKRGRTRGNVRKAGG
jgi:hypothetical protein